MSDMGTESFWGEAKNKAKTNTKTTNTLKGMKKK